MTDPWLKKIESSWENIAKSPEPTRNGSAVLLPLLYDENGETAILFEHRALDLDVQPDEICFPGGGIEDGETPEEAVLRETQEELLIDAEQVRLLGRFAGLAGHTILTIHTFVGIMEGYQNTFSTDEVDHVFTVPLRWFLEHPPEAYGTTLTTVPDADFPFDRIPGGRNYPWRSSRNTIYFYQYGKETIWGLTARILVAFLHQVCDMASEKMVER